MRRGSPQVERFLAGIVGRCRGIESVLSRCRGIKRVNIRCREISFFRVNRRIVRVLGDVVKEILAMLRECSSDH